MTKSNLPLEPRILVTLGPSSLNNNIISEMIKESVYLFRINLSHTQIEDVERTINKIREYADVPICLDSEGAQLRNNHMENGEVIFRKEDKVKVHFNKTLGDSENISFGPEHVESQLEVGDIIAVDFNSVQLEIIEKQKDHFLTNVTMGGKVGSNKAANVNKPIKLNAITTKDKEAIKIGRRMGIQNYALSFANSAEDVIMMRELTGKDSNLISKVESINGLNNLKGIIDVSDAILIDRGDLSREVSQIKIPFMQRRIISLVKSRNKPVYVATNLLESMIGNLHPTKAETNDVVSTLLMGANGLVLASETAIGNFPVESIRYIRSLINQYLAWTPNTTIEELLHE